MNTQRMASQAMAVCAGGAKADTSDPPAAKTATRARVHFHLTQTVPFKNRISL
ncbi:hypothetical protein K3759_07900 [Sulfitobacter sp. W027]|uniref:hypothetical protein n=1 Tax=Sulfitobacter sp. W027 TaxID=2867025 RepID=UPI0021A3ECDD|nr:hypothetical protein [Sulfitobacter sp. W027]UWR34999.1 hypothetical protein K3759_07900 [Sulfitobacter sp. W027]